MEPSHERSRRTEMLISESVQPITLHSQKRHQIAFQPLRNILSCVSQHHSSAIEQNENISAPQYQNSRNFPSTSNTLIILKQKITAQQESQQPKRRQTRRLPRRPPRQLPHRRPPRAEQVHHHLLPPVVPPPPPRQPRCSHP
jgi:hypothetical protein